MEKNKIYPCVRCTKEEFYDKIAPKLRRIGYVDKGVLFLDNLQYIVTNYQGIERLVSNVSLEGITNSTRRFLCASIPEFLEKAKELAIENGWFKEEGDSPKASTTGTGKTSENLTIEEYQRRAMTTCTDSSRNYHYMMSNLIGEVGEFNSKVGKLIRKDNGHFEAGKFCITDNTAENERLLKMELGDILWQLAGVASVQGWSLSKIAQMNLNKLASRKDRGTIVGDGDER